MAAMASARRPSSPPVTKSPKAHLGHAPARTASAGAAVADDPATAGSMRTAADDYPDLVRAAAGGDAAAMERLLMRAQEVAWRFSSMVCGHTEDAEDVMQDALVTTYTRAASIREPQAFRAWLYRTVRNACLMRRRTRVDEPKRMLSLDELLPTPDGARAFDPPAATRTPEDLAINAHLRARMKKALASLPAPYRLVLFLRDMEGLSTREVATVLGTSEDNVKQRLHRARLFLREELVS
jgi:RNA polymerase sigma-70 factor (ECF subfamily)